MRTYLYQPLCFVVLLIICLMFAPARYFTGDVPIYPVQPPAPSGPLVLPASEKSFAELCKDDPLGALARSLSRYRSDVEGYTCTFIKRERIGGKLRDRETIVAEFRESPFSVKLRWTEGQGRAIGMLYPADDRNDRLAVVPSNDVLRKVIPFVIKSVNDREVRDAARSPVTEFGIFHATNRAYRDWRIANDRGQLKTQYEGTRPIEELNGRVCHVLHRECVHPEEDGLTKVTLFFDSETHLLAGAILRAGDELIASYHYRDMVLNPKFMADHFSTAKLK